MLRMMRQRKEKGEEYSMRNCVFMARVDCMGKHENGDDVVVSLIVTVAFPVFAFPSSLTPFTSPLTPFSSPLTIASFKETQIT